MPLPIFLKDYLFLIVFLRFKNVVFPGEKPTENAILLVMDVILIQYSYDTSIMYNIV